MTSRRPTSVFFTLVALAVVALLTTSAAAGAPPAPAPGEDPAPNPIPDPAPDDPPEETPPSGATPGVNTSETSPNGSSPGGGGGLIPNPEFPDPVTFVTEAFVGFVEGLVQGVYMFLGGLTATIFGVPTVGDPENPLTWLDVDGPFWPIVRTGYLVSSLISLVILGGVLMRVRGNYDGRELQRKQGQVLRSAGMIIVGWWIIQLQFHIVNIFTEVFAPNPDVLFQTPGNAAKFGLTMVAGALLLLINGGVVVMAGFVVLLEKAVLLLTAAMWPFFWAARPGGSYVNTVSGLGLGTHYGVLGAKGFQAFLAWIVWNIDWSSTHAVEAVGAALGTIVGSSVTFFFVPLIVGRNFVPEAMTMFGQPAVDVADDFSDTSREHARAAVSNYAASVRNQNTTNDNSSTATSTTTATHYRHDTTTTHRTRTATQKGPKPTRAPSSRYGRAGASGADAGRSQSTRTNRRQRGRGSGRRPGS